MDYICPRLINGGADLVGLAEDNNRSHSGDLEDVTPLLPQAIVDEFSRY
jgi:hypothetical protein